MTTDLHGASERRIIENGKGILTAAAIGLLPDPQELVSAWAENFRIVPDIGAIPGEWHNDVAPELVEIMDCLSPDHPCEQVVLMKPSQSGGSAVAENWIGYIMHRTPAPTMYVGPTVGAAQDWYQEKLGPTISATPVLSPDKGGVVAPNKSRSGEGSTSKRLRFRGGFLLLAGANSAATLRQHSVRFMVRDDRSAWTNNADNEGDPKDLSDARLKTYRVFGLAKVFDVSSPKFEDEDIDAELKRGDQRHYYLACLGCGALVDLGIEDLVHNPVPPYRAHYTCSLCGRDHFNVDKRDMKAPANGACWIATVADADGVMPPKVIPKAEIEQWRHRTVGPQTVVSFRMVGEANTFETWDNLVARKLSAGDDPVKLQPFQNSDLGRAYKPKTDVPGWEVLSARREADWHRGSAPAGVLYVTLTADVQGDGIYYAYLGWGPNKQVWHLDHGFLPGPTDAPLEGAWPKLDLVADRGIQFNGLRIAPDMMAVDSGYNALAVYAWVKRRHNAIAVKGEDGWSKQPIYRSKTTEMNRGGQKVGQAKKFGLRVWLVGTWGLKGALMVYLGREAKEGDTGLPSGFQHFAADTEKDYFEHLTSEYVHTETVHGEKCRSWKARGANHWLDCNVYGWALTYYVGLWNWTEERWEQRAAELAQMLEQPATDFFEQPILSVPAVTPVFTDDDVPAPETAQALRIKSKRDDGLDALKALNR